MKNLFFFLLGLAVTLLLGLLVSETASAAAATECDIQLTVELTPDVPDPSDAGFLSSLLNNHPGYRLELLRVIDPALIELDLVGPGPGYRCEGVIDTMRKDARVLSVRIDNTGETPSLTVMAPATAEELPHVSNNGIGSVYWAARHPSQAWRVLLPVRSGTDPGDEALKQAGTVNRG